MDPSSSLGVYTTIYPAVSGYLVDWYGSLQEQTDKNFQLWIGLDALTGEEVEEIIGCKVDAHWLQAPQGATPAQIRQIVLAQMIDACDGVVLVDSDDLLEPSRIEAARAQLVNFELGGCALRLVGESGSDLDQTFTLPKNLELVDVFPRWNVFGFSNSVYHSRLLRRLLPIPESAALVDWFLSTKAWLVGSKMGFDCVPRMKYRQYLGTMAHIRLPFTAPQVIAHTEMVRHHFKLVLAALPHGTIEKRRAALANAQEDTEKFWHRVVRDETALNNYVDALNKLAPAPIWWTSVAYPPLQSMWSN